MIENIRSDSIYDVSTGRLLFQSTQAQLSDGSWKETSQVYHEIELVMEPNDSVKKLIEEKERRIKERVSGKKVLLSPVFNASDTVYSSVAGITTTSKKYITQATISTTFSLSSSVPSTQKIDKIGYTWWTIQKVCPDGTYAYYNRRENQYYSGSNSVYQFSDRGLIEYNSYPCPPGETYGSFGNHMYVQDGSQDYPRLDITDP